MDDANTLGLYFATAVIVGLGLILTQTGWRRWLSLGCVAVTANGLILTNTRGATLGLVAGGMVLALFKARAHRGLFWMLALVGLIGVTSIIDQGFIDRMVTIQDVTSDSEEADSSARSRIVVLQAQVQMFLDYPMGSGHRGTAALSPQYLDERWLTTDWRGTARSSHNTFMSALVEQGIPGAVLFLWLTLWTLIAILKLRRLELQHGDPNLTTLASATGGALVVIFVTGFSADFLLVEVQFWLFAAFVSVLQLAAIGSTSERAAASPALARHGVA